MKVAHRKSQTAAQGGAVLVTGLIILVVMTIIGITSMQTTVLQERMAGNLREQNVAFQAAEAGLQAGLTFLEEQNLPPRPDSTGSTGVWPGCTIDVDTDLAGNACAFLSDVIADWRSQSTPTEGRHFVDDLGLEPLTGVVAQPRVLIEERYSPPLEFEAAAQGRGIHFYTVSALGSGATPSARSLLQTTIAKVYAW